MRMIEAPVFSRMLCPEEEPFCDWRISARRVALCVDNVRKMKSKHKIFIKYYCLIYTQHKFLLLTDLICVQSLRTVEFG